jgi:hypothetical protein
MSDTYNVIKRKKKAQQQRRRKKKEEEGRRRRRRRGGPPAPPSFMWHTFSKNAAHCNALQWGVVNIVPTFQPHADTGREC